jgi:hypothetical protein
MTRSAPQPVIPAHAGIQKALGPRLRGDDAGRLVR